MGKNNSQTSISVTSRNFYFSTNLTEKSYSSIFFSIPSFPQVYMILLMLWSMKIIKNIFECFIQQ